MSVDRNVANVSYDHHPTALMESLVEEVVGDPAELERSLRDRLTAKILRERTAEKDKSQQTNAFNSQIVKLDAEQKKECEPGCAIATNEVCKIDLKNEVLKSPDPDKSHSKVEEKESRKNEKTRDNHRDDRTRDKKHKDERRESKRDEKKDRKKDRSHDRKEKKENSDRRKRSESSRHKSHDERKERSARSKREERKESENMKDRKADRHRERDDNNRGGDKLNVAEKDKSLEKPMTESAEINVEKSDKAQPSDGALSSACPFDGPDLKRRRLALVQSSAKDSGSSSRKSIAKELRDDLEAYVMETDGQGQPAPPASASSKSQMPAPSGALKPRFSIGITPSSLERITGQQAPSSSATIISSAANPAAESPGAIQKASTASSDGSSSLVKINAPPNASISNAASEPSASASATTAAAAAAAAHSNLASSTARSSIAQGSSKRSSHFTSKSSSSRAKAESPRPRRRSPRSSKEHNSSSRRRDSRRSRRRSRSSSRSSSPRRSRRRSRSSSRSSSRGGRRRSPPSRRRAERSHSRGRRDEKSRSRRSPSASRESRLGIDKKKLRRIAIMNVLRSMRLRLTNAAALNPEQLNRFKASGISVEEVQEVCQRLATKKEKLRASGADDAAIEAATLTEEEDVGDPGPGLEGGKPLKIKDRFLVGSRAPDVQPLLGASGVEPLMGQSALREIFPVSSGILHRTNGSDANEQPAKAATVSGRTAEPEQASQLVKDPRLGQYTGKVEVKLLTQKDLEGGVQPWVKKNQFMSARPVQNSIGEQLLRQMGWKEGEGLGKNKDGKTQPVHVDIKVDRKGLASLGEKVSNKKSLPTLQELKYKGSPAGQSGKHPVSVLMEQANKRRWGAPVYTLVSENGPSHAKTFMMSVKVNGQVILSEKGCRSKKDAKLAAAAAAVRQLRLS